MKIPKRYITVNTNIAWKEEGAVFESIDFKKVYAFKLGKNDEIVIYYQDDENNDAIYEKIYYPMSGIIGTTLLFSSIERRINEWAKYKEQVSNYTIKHSKKEIDTTQMIYNLSTDDSSDSDDDEDFDDDDD